jgi:acetylornithine/N-succinyldiaminopimelate aminotransferase
MVLETLQITRGRNEILIASNGQEYIDLITGFGAVLLGHSNQAILERVRKQLADVWLTGRLQVPVVEEAANLVISGLTKPYRHLQFYSSGNEAVEFAIRMATTATHRQSLVGFDRSMHGKSIAASALSWQNNFVDVKNVSTLPFVDSCSEAEILERLKRELAARNVAAVFLELIQGTNGAHEASAEFYRTVGDMCREHGTLCVVDEVLTGFYRAGSLSYSQDIGLTPDILIFGKAMGNGFPVSAVVCQSGIEVTDAMLLGSTFSNNPLVASAVAATLTEMRRLNMDQLLENVDRSVRAELSPLTEYGASLRGRGALWILELPDSRSALETQATALSANIVLSANGRFVRLFPPATISSANLHKALRIVSEACRKSLNA